MTPCGVIPKTGAVVDAIIESAAGIIAGFEANRFRSLMEKEFYDIDETPAGQMLFVCLSTIAHIWNGALTSRLEIKPVKFSKKYDSDLLITHYLVERETRSVKKQLGIVCELPGKKDESKVDGKGDDHRNVQDKIQKLICPIEKIIRNPFETAHEIVRTLVGKEWQTYEFIHNNTLRVTPSEEVKLER